MSYTKYTYIYIYIYKIRQGNPRKPIRLVHRSTFKIMLCNYYNKRVQEMSFFFSFFFYFLKKLNYAIILVRAISQSPHFYSCHCTRCLKLILSCYSGLVVNERYLQMAREVLLGLSGYIFITWRAKVRAIRVIRLSIEIYRIKEYFWQCTELFTKLQSSYFRVPPRPLPRSKR